MRELLKLTLSGCAEIVGECTDGAQALAAYRRLRPDWVLMDVELPRLDGIAAAGQIIEEDPAARVVMVTNHKDAGLRRAARTAGACGYVLKENLLELLDILEGPKR
ncbi:MAG: response regulator transcription factor [Acidobacteria bacterium]|nr:response regulator transcription factor [Acidobacteriota bacterium]